MLAVAIAFVLSRQAPHPWVNALPFGDARIPRIPAPAAVSAQTKKELITYARELLDNARRDLMVGHSSPPYRLAEVDKVYNSIGKQPSLKDLEKSNPQRALKLLLSDGTNPDYQLLSLFESVVDSAPEIAEAAIAAERRRSLKEQMQDEMCAKYARAYPARAAATAARMSDPKRKLSALAHAARAYLKSNRLAAQTLADAAAEIFPRNAGSLVSMQASLYELACVGSSNVRSLLTSLETIARAEDHRQANAYSCLMILAGAWSQIDANRAGRLMSEALRVNPRSRLYVEGTLSDGFEQYLLGIAKRDGRRAGEELLRLCKSMSLQAEGDLVLLNAGQDIEDELWPDYVAQIRAFDSKTRANVYPTLDERILRTQLLDDPKKNLHLIDKMANGYDVAVELCRRLGKTGELRLAERLISSRRMNERLSLYCELADSLANMHPERCLHYFKQAERQVDKEPNGVSRAEARAEIAQAVISVAQR